MGPEDGPQETDVDALRRRLYAPGATAADSARYGEALRDAHGTVEAHPLDAMTVPEPPPARAPTRRRARRRSIAVLAAGAIAATVAVALVLPATRERAEAPVVASPAAVAVAVALPASVRARFVRRLEAGRGAGFAAYFGQHPDARPAQLTTLTRAVTEEYDGSGPTSVPLSPTGAAGRGGQLTVIVTLAHGGEVRWRVSRPAVRTNHEPYDQVVADRRGRQIAGTPVSVTIRYSGAAPTRLRIAASRGGRWDAVVVFSD